MTVEPPELRAILIEAAKHGANKADLTLLRTEFERLSASNKTNNQAAPAQTEIPDDTTS